MDRRRLLTTASLAGTGLAVAIALAVTATARGDGASRITGAATFGESREELSVPTVADPDAWVVHPYIHSYTDVAGLQDGRWLVLDALGHRLHVLEPDLTHAHSFGGQGDGPGELSRPLRIAVTGDTSVAVLDASGTRLDLFSPDGSFRDRLTIRVAGCAAGVSEELVPDPTGSLAAWGVCSGPGGPEWTAVRIAHDGETVVLARDPLSRGGRISLPLGRGLMAWADRLWLGGPDGCFTDVSSDPGPIHCLSEASPVRLSEEARAKLTRGPPGRAGAAAPALDIPETLPPIIATYWSAAGPLLLLPRSPGPGEPDTQRGDLALLRDDGSLRVIQASAAVFVGWGGVLLARAFQDGTGFRTVAWP